MKALSIEVLESANLTEDYTAVKPVHAKLGPAFKADAKVIVAEIAKLDPKAVAADLAKDGKVKVSVNGSEIELNSEYLVLEKRLMLDGKPWTLSRSGMSSSPSRCENGWGPPHPPLLFFSKLYRNRWWPSLSC